MAGMQAMIEPAATYTKSCL